MALCQCRSQGWLFAKGEPIWPWQVTPGSARPTPEARVNMCLYHKKLNLDDFTVLACTAVHVSLHVSPIFDSVPFA